MVSTPRLLLRRYMIVLLVTIFIISGYFMIADTNFSTVPRVQSNDPKFGELIGHLQDQVLELEQKISRLTGEDRTVKSDGHTPMAKKKYPRICCFVITDPNLLKDTAFSRDTWTRRCDRSFFMSSAENKSFPTIGLGNDTLGKNRLIVKARKSWIYLYTHHINECEYFVKADPDTYIIIENLKDYLSNFNPEDSQHFGHVYSPPEEAWSYLAGGPGEVLSRRALKDLVEKAFRGRASHFKICQGKTGGEDRAIGKCLALIRSQAVDTRDSKGRQRFIVFGVSYLILGVLPEWYINLHLVDGKLLTGLQCCSDYPIGFHYVNKESLKTMDYFLFGVKKKFDLGISPFLNDTKQTSIMQ